MNITADNSIILGIGDGGCQIVASMAVRWHAAPQAILINTELTKWPNIAGIQIATHSTDNIRNQIAFSNPMDIGTGGNPRFGRRAVELYADQIKNVLQNKRFAIIVTALGGGTGTGATPFVVETASRMNIRTVVFATLPFDFE